MVRIKATEFNRENTGEKVEQILQGAMQEFLARGFAGTSMEKVATAAGVSKPTVYSYFKDKESLFQALIENLAKKKFNSTFGSEPIQGEPRIVLRRLATIFLKQMDEDEEFDSFMRVIVGESGRFPELAKLCVGNLFKPLFEIVTNYLASHPELEISDPQAAALVFFGTLTHYHISHDILNGKEVIPVEGERVVDILMDFMLKSSQYASANKYLS